MGTRSFINKVINFTTYIVNSTSLGTKMGTFKSHSFWEIEYCMPNTLSFWNCMKRHLCCDAWIYLKGISIPGWEFPSSWICYQTDHWPVHFGGTGSQKWSRPDIVTWGKGAGCARDGVKGAEGFSRPDMVWVVTKYCSLQILCHTLEIIPDYLGNFVESEKLTKLQRLQEFSAKCANLWA